MVESMINGSQFLYQTLGGTVYHVSDDITTIHSWPCEAITAYVDADDNIEPLEFLFRPWIKIMAASSPKGTDQPWVKQMGNYEFPIKFVTALWTESELMVAGLFLHPRDLTYARLKDSTTYLGFNPRLCFNSCLTPTQLRQLRAHIKEAIRKIAANQNIRSLITSFERSLILSQSVFQLSPLDDQRLFGEAQIGTVSPWALNALLETYEKDRANAATEFYESIANMPNAESLRGRMFERQVLKYFDSLEGPRTFSIRSLDDSTTLDWVYPGPAKRHMFQSLTFGKELHSAIVNKEPLHLVPKDWNFPTLDSVLYCPNDGIFGIQATTRVEHPVTVAGFKRIQRWLRREIALANLRPSTVRRCWPLIFVTPDTIADSFTKQDFEGDTAKGAWSKKVDQYVLGIKEHILWAKSDGSN